MLNRQPEHDDFSRLALYFDKFPNGSSTKTVYHFVQTIQLKVFAEYIPDYNGFQQVREDQIRVVDLSKIGQTVPIAFFYAEQDKLGT